jgi:hypothetical protein
MPNATMHGSGSGAARKFGVVIEARGRRQLFESGKAKKR